MAVKLTTKTIDAAKGRLQAYDVRDAHTRGLLLRVHPSGIKTWFLQWKRGKRIKLGRADVVSLEEARKRARARLSEIDQHGEPVSRVQQGLTLGEFIEQHYKAHALAHQRDGRANIANIKVQFGHLNGKPLEHLSNWLIEKWRQEKLKEGMARSTINRHWDRLRAVLNRALEWGHLSDNPVSKIRPLKTDQRGVVRYLSATEERDLRGALRKRDVRLIEARRSANRWRQDRGYQLLRALPHFGDHLTPMVLVSLNTGLRRGELVSLTWDRIDMDNRMLTVLGAFSKSGQTRHIPLNAEAIDVLTRWRAQCGEGERLFPVRTVNNSWPPLRAAAKLKDFRWHDLRHTFASRLAQIGIDLNTIRELMGHSDIEMTLIYAHLSPQHRRDAVDRLVSVTRRPKDFAESKALSL